MNILFWLILIILSTLWILAFTYLSHSIFSKIKRKETFVPFIPIDRNGLKEIINNISFSEAKVIYDIGSGWGTALFFFAKRFPEIEFKGIEINPILHLFATIRKRILNIKNVMLNKGDAKAFSYKDADIIFIFMLPCFVQKILVPLLERDLRKGTRVISYVFPIVSTDFAIKEIELPNNGWRNKMYVATKR